MLKILYAGCPGLSAVILVQFTVEICTAAKNRGKNPKTRILFQGHLREEMLQRR